MDDIEPSAELFPNFSDADLQRVVECVFQDETGFGDPLANGGEGFDIWNIINENSNPNSSSPGTSEGKRSPQAAAQYNAAKAALQAQLVVDPQNNRLTIDPYANGQWSCQTGPGASSGNSSVSPSSSSWPQHTPPGK
ncbi:hypothetical protein AAVH_19133 [Aphelenchoides avenae]|nr:hypothetical protein AAVH_19133 [Aphelenchus avenae]